MTHRVDLPGATDRSVGPGLLVPGTVEPAHPSPLGKELPLRVRLARQPVTQLVEEGALEVLGEQLARVSQHQWRPPGEITRDLPRTLDELLLRHHLRDDAPLQRLLCAQFLPHEQHGTRPVRPDEHGPEHVLAIARHQTTGKCARSWKYAVSDARTMSASSGTSEWMLHGPLTALMIGTSTARMFSISMRPYHAFSSSCMRPSWPSIA